MGILLVSLSLPRVVKGSLWEQTELGSLGKIPICLEAVNVHLFDLGLKTFHTSPFANLDRAKVRI